MSRSARTAVVCFVALAFAVSLAACGSSKKGAVAGPDVPYAKVQAVCEKYGCTGCHPGVNPSLDLTKGKSYDDLVGIQALEDPRLYRVVAGDPGKSFLYLKLGGDAPIFDIPAIGTRMPPQSPPDRSGRPLARPATGSSAGPRGSTEPREGRGDHARLPAAGSATSNSPRSNAAPARSRAR